ncbi:unnamed protein product [Amoebophrya sp. A120]|nr:unnamed protein product [Amoebophrya sp. A120]|eukprot:GSA120T00018545001.1
MMPMQPGMLLISLFNFKVVLCPASLKTFSTHSEFDTFRVTTLPLCFACCNRLASFHALFLLTTLTRKHTFVVTPCFPIFSRSEIQRKMVLFYTCQTDPKWVVYCGVDKFENEKLLQNGFPEDLWFHVNNLSSAHVYLRIPTDKWRILLDRCYPPHGIPGKGEQGLARLTEEDYRSVIPDDIIHEMCVLVKGNSISGSKQAEVDIVWTPFANLRKDQQTMDTGTVGFVNEKQTWYKKNVPTCKELLKKLEKSKKDIDVDLPAKLDERLKEEISYRKRKIAAAKEAEKLEVKQRAKEKELKSYDNLHMRMGDCVSTNDLGPGYTGTIDECREVEEDFM